MATAKPEPDAQVDLSEVNRKAAEAAVKDAPKSNGPEREGKRLADAK